MSPCFTASYLTDSRPQDNRIAECIRKLHIDGGEHYLQTLIMYTATQDLSLWERKVSVGKEEKERHTLQCTDTTSTINHNQISEHHSH